MLPIKQERSIKVFIDYARRDWKWRDKLVKHLSPLEHSGEITFLQGPGPLAGTDWEDSIPILLNEADVILLLVSADFITSEHFWSKIIQIALERHKAGTARVIPIILKPALWEDTPLGQLQVLPTSAGRAKPITQWRDLDAALDNVGRGIRHVVKNLDLYPPTRFNFPPSLPTRDGTVRFRIVEEPLTAQNLITIVSALAELSTKYWLIAKGRFADLIEYTQTHDGRFVQESNIVITRISHNSPMNMDWKVDVSAPSVAEAVVTTIDGITQVKQRIESAKLGNEEKAQQIEQAKQRADHEQQMALLE